MSNSRPVISEDCAAFAEEWVQSAGIDNAPGWFYAKSDGLPNVELVNVSTAWGLSIGNPFRSFVVQVDGVLPSRTLVGPPISTKDQAMAVMLAVARSTALARPATDRCA